MDLSLPRRSRGVAGDFASWWPPLLAWLAATAVVLVTSAAEGWAPFAATRTWARWDSGFYLQIADGGYRLFRCPSPHRPPVNWCGNSGWFPGYSWIVGGLHWLALPLAPTALAVSWLAFLGALLVVWRAFLIHQPGPQAAAALTYAAFTPGLAYDYGIYPLALLSLCTVAFFAFLRRGHWLAAGVIAAVGGLAYPVGLVAAPVAALWLLAERGVAFSQRVVRAALVAGPTLAALAFFALLQQLETGHWNAYLLTQAKYHHHLSSPLVTVARTLAQAARTPLELASAPALQTLLISLLLICVGAAVAIRRDLSTRFDVLIVIWAAAVWLVLYAQTSLDAYRGVAGLLPLAVLMPRLPWPLAAAIAVAAILIAVPMETLYLRAALT
jgi:hypothetical protein